MAHFVAFVGRTLAARNTDAPHRLLSDAENYGEDGIARMPRSP